MFTPLAKTVVPKLHEKYGPVQSQTYSPEIEADNKKELLGEIIYPLALKMYSNHAAKLTGMLLDALLKLNSDEKIKQVIESRSTINELVSNMKNNLLIDINHLLF